MEVTNINVMRIETCMYPENKVYCKRVQHCQYSREYFSPFQSGPMKVIFLNKYEQKFKIFLDILRQKVNTPF